MSRAAVAHEGRACQSDKEPAEEVLQIRGGKEVRAGVLLMNLGVGSEGTDEIPEY